ncbi:MAG: TIGR02266 family protein [Deltaproteobacteria bacterium]|nr:TIGR02266 family protein [Deltaproteobacteria bacterium]
MLITASEEFYQDGDIIIEEGSSGDWVYVVNSGTVEISKTIDGKKYIVARLGPGEVFGELGFLGSVPRTATARAIGETSVGILDRTYLDTEYNRLSSEFRTVLSALVKRFKQMNDRAVEYTSRKEFRTQKTLSLNYADRAAFVDAHTENVGTRGLFIRTDNPFEEGEQFLLELVLPGLPNTMEIKCEVVWARKQGEEPGQANGMGVKFVEITEEDEQTLKDYLSP